MKKDPEEIDEEVYDDTEDEEIPFEYSINSYGADYPVDTLIKRLENKVIFVPHFQREYVWTIKQASRFIESLLLGLPVPGVFLSKEADTEKLLIIDGQQRLKTLEFFYEGLFKTRIFALEGVQAKFEGKTYKTLDAEERRRLDDSIIHATVIRQEEPTEDNSSVYHIFERLNTGGTELQPQEIRACIYWGPFNDFLEECRSNKDWQKVYGRPSNKMKDAELILRFFSLYFEEKKYAKPMKDFLNKFMSRNRNFGLYKRELLKEKFSVPMSIIANIIGKKAFRPERSLNAAVFDAVMVGLARRLDNGPIKDLKTFSRHYELLLADKVFLSNCQTGTSSEAKVKARVESATKSFLEIK